MGNGLAQQPLFAIAVDERRLDDPARTVLEAIDTLGTITARQAGVIVYRFRGYCKLLGIPKAWLVDAGRKILNRLHAGGLVSPVAGGRWSRP